MTASLADLCKASTFNPSLFGAEILNINADLVTNFSGTATANYRQVAPQVELKNAEFCNVTVTYTHPGQDDNINVEAWLPTRDWKGRLQAQGGGGFAAGRVIIPYTAMIGAFHDGYAGITTDAGVGTTGDPRPWALKSPGNLNWPLLQNLAAISLNDMAIIGKSLLKSFYGKEPDYSYFIGCSQGGRQGMMLAQRYPTAFDGIISGAPGLNLNEVFFGTYWAQQIMNELGEYPAGCEIDAITAAAVEDCDALDGVKDSLISDSVECLAKFDPFSVVGKEIECKQKNGELVRISESAAKTVNATWHGIETVEGQIIWPGLMPGSDLTGNNPKNGAGFVAGTNCTTTPCTASPSPFGAIWLEYFVEKGRPGVDVSKLDRTAFTDLVKAGRNEFLSILGTFDPDLSRFKKAGGKLISYHGLSDTLLSAKGTENYYRNVADTVPGVEEFLRYYPIPGLGHCEEAQTSNPDSLYKQLRDWVENGKAPGHTNVRVTVGEDEQHERIVCPFPSIARLESSCGDPSKAESWSCKEN